LKQNVAVESIFGRMDTFGMRIILTGCMNRINVNGYVVPFVARKKKSKIENYETPGRLFVRMAKTHPEIIIQDSVGSPSNKCSNKTYYFQAKSGKITKIQTDTE
jgi:hypothetical protein